MCQKQGGGDPRTFKVYHWKHVSSKNNPADLISRGCNVDELLKNEMWFLGPDLQTEEHSVIERVTAHFSSSL
ncbi:hypothetical protein TNCV_2958031 [Trichonephila clavipes]|nr:hypothetical protein TNCV_2958031 [Trichonephila clavipes]